MLQVNAYLTRIAPSAAPDDWDVDVAGGAEKWSGRLEAYLREKVDRAQGTAGIDVLTRRTLWVDTAALPAELDTDDVITVELEDGTELTSPARTIARSSLAGAEAVSTTRIDLEDA